MCFLSVKAAVPQPFLAGQVLYFYYLALKKKMWLGEHLLKPTKKKIKYSMVTSNMELCCANNYSPQLETVSQRQTLLWFEVPSYASALAAQF